MRPARTIDREGGHLSALVALLIRDLRRVSGRPPTYVNPQPGGGYVVTTPGTNQLPTYVNPTPGYQRPVAPCYGCR